MHLDRAPEAGQPRLDGRPDGIECWAAHERRQQVDPDRVVGNLDPLDDSEIDDRNRRDLRVGDVGECGSNGRFVHDRYDDHGSPRRPRLLAADRGELAPQPAERVRMVRSGRHRVGDRQRH